MINILKKVESLDSEGLEPYRTLKRPLSHRDRGIFIVEGNKVVKRFLDSSLTVVSILLTPEWFSRYSQILEKKTEPVNVFIASVELIKEIVGFQYHQGIMAVGLIPPPLSLKDATTFSNPPFLFAALENIESAENTGVIVRNCAACGIQALIVGETSADPYLRRSVRNSMGTIFKLPVVYSSDLNKTLAELRTNHNFQILAAHPRADSTLLSDVNFRTNSCVVFGNEGRGISDRILSECDKAVTIPMAPEIDSFNVACAGAIILYEAMRQRLTALR